MFPQRKLESEHRPCELLVMWRREKCSPLVVKAILGLPGMGMFTQKGSSPPQAGLESGSAPGVYR